MVTAIMGEKSPEIRSTKAIDVTEMQLAGRTVVILGQSRCPHTKQSERTVENPRCNLYGEPQ